jgi:GWxTD domain-containing protein
MAAIMTPADSLVMAGAIRLEIGDASHAVDLLKEAVERNPGLAEAHAGLGIAYAESRVRRKKWKESERAFQTALKLNPGMASAHDGLGVIALYGEENPKEARIHFEAALALDPGSSKIRFHLGLADLQADDRNLKRAAERALNKDSTDVAACRVMAEHHANRDEFDKAIAFYERCFLEAPEDEDAAYQLGVIYAVTQRFDELRQMLRAMEDRAFHRRFLPLVAQVFLSEGDARQAVAVFTEYIQMLDKPEAALYGDISLVASLPEQAAYARTPKAEQNSFLNRFWIRHDLSVVTGGDLRRAEHYRRVWHSRASFSMSAYPWDKRGDVYVRYGEPDYRSTSDKLNADIPANAQRIKERMAVDLYGPDAVGEVYTGPVFPVRSNRAFGLSPPSVQDLGLSEEEIRLVFMLEDVSVSERNELITRAERADGGQGDQARMVLDQQERSGEQTDEGGGDLAISPSQVRQQRFVEQSMGLFMPVTSMEDASIVPWESWVYTMVAEGLEVTFTDEYFQGNFDFAPVPTHVPNELKERYVAVRDLTDFLFNAPDLVVKKMASRIPDFHDFARGAQPLDFWYRTARFRGQDGLTRLEVYFGLSPDSLLGHRAGVWIERNAALVNPELDKVYSSERKFYMNDRFLKASIDTVQGWQDLVLDMATLEAPAGSYEFAVRIREPGTRRFQLYKQQVDLEEFTSTKLQISDVQLAWSIGEPDGKDQMFVKRGLKVMPMSVWAFPKSHPAFLYFEVYNLTLDEFGQSRYRVTYDIRSKDEDNKGAQILSGLGNLLGKEEDERRVRVTYDQVGNEGDGIGYVGLDLASAGLGEQEVVVTVEDLVGRSLATKTTTFGIR